MREEEAGATPAAPLGSARSAVRGEASGGALLGEPAPSVSLCLALGAGGCRVSPVPAPAG